MVGFASVNIDARSNACKASLNSIFPQRAMPFDIYPVNDGWMLIDYVKLANSKVVMTLREFLTLIASRRASFQLHCRAKTNDLLA